MEYSQEIKNCIENKITVLEDVFDFKDTPLEELICNFYVFCRENLNSESEKIKIAPSFLFFKNSNEVNARAGIKNNFFFIAINLGLLRYCFENYQLNTDLADYFTQIHPETFKKFDNPVNVLAFQVCTQFTYYHELAHLIQLSNTGVEINIQERQNEVAEGNFDFVKHVLEVNADIYASISVATHIEQYIGKTFHKEVTSENISQTIVFFCCSILNYILSFSDQLDDLYFDKHTHPHPFVRLLNVILNIINHIENSQYLNSYEIQLDGKTLFKTVVDMYNDLEKNQIFKSKLPTLADDDTVLEQLIQYVSLLNQFNADGYVNAMDVWNNSVK